MEIETVLLIIALASGFYMAWSVGANDVANAMGTSVGSGALTVKQAVLIAAALEFMGAFFAGSQVSETIRKGIINPAIFQGNEMALVYGMIGALLAAAVWLQVASYFGLPVSTTHSIVGAVLGFGVMYGGIQAADWPKVASIVASWVISPLMSGTIAFVSFTLLSRLIYNSDEPVRVAKKITPYLTFLVVAILTLAMVFKGLKNLHLNLDFPHALLAASSTGFFAAVGSFFLVRRIQPVEIEERVLIKQPLAVKKRLEKALRHLEKGLQKARGGVRNRIVVIADDLRTVNLEVDQGESIEQGSVSLQTVEKIFAYLQILGAAFIAFAHGANDVANAVGPLAAVIATLASGQVSMQNAVPLWVLGIGGLGIVIGLATWGWRVMMTIGKKITELTPTRGFVATISAAATIVLASKLGLPISTTHTLVGGVLGVGLARGISALNLRVVTNIVISWVVTIPIGAIGAIGFYHILKAIFG